MASIPATLLESLSPSDLQALAVYRSKQLDVAKWVDRLRTYKEKLERDQASRTSLEGVLLRLEQFAEGQMARQYGSVASGVGVEDLGLLGDPAHPWGITVIEGGCRNGRISQGSLTFFAGQHPVFDAVARRREALDGKHFPPMQIFFEEANKVLTGVSGGAASDQGSGESATRSAISSKPCGGMGASTTFFCI